MKGIGFFRVIYKSEEEEGLRRRFRGGFSLLEVLLALAVIFIVLAAAAALNSTAWKYWDKNQEKIDLKQQARIISRFLNRDIKAASAVQVLDSDGDGREELWLNLGDYQGEGDDTDQATDYYLQYEVVARKLVFRKPGSAFNETGVSYPSWPSSADWGISRAVTMEIIGDFNLSFNQEIPLVSYVFELSQQGEEYRLEGQIHPRVLSPWE